MQANRRQFIARSAISGLGLVAAPLMQAEFARAATPARQDAAPPIVASTARYYRLSPADGVRREEFGWIQIDLGVTRPIDAVRLHPAEIGMLPQQRSQIHFRIEGSDDPAFEETRPLVDWHAEDHGDPANFLARFPLTAVNARYIRVSATAEIPFGGSGLASGLATIEILSGADVLPIAVRRREANCRRGLKTGSLL
ncbi:discoidin domain-containing protein [Sphingopyxis sp. J-6]|uniref:discoidin domain-containing protein n=1 Tax=Sphingopyxis sp. J-6 TaxID=3122054 RepID=UPI00398445B7